MKVKASIKNFRTTPRKARLIADFVRGKNVKKAIAELSFLNKKASDEFIKLINSAVANAENNFSIKSDDLFIETIFVDEGKALKRHRSASNGRASAFRRRLSHINLTLEEKTVKLN